MKKTVMILVLVIILGVLGVLIGCGNDEKLDELIEKLGMDKSEIVEKTEKDGEIRIIYGEEKRLIGIFDNYSEVTTSGYIMYYEGKVELTIDEVDELDFKKTLWYEDLKNKVYENGGDDLILAEFRREDIIFTDNTGLNGAMRVEIWSKSDKEKLEFVWFFDNGEFTEAVREEK